MTPVPELLRIEVICPTLLNMAPDLHQADAGAFAAKGESCLLFSPLKIAVVLWTQGSQPGAWLKKSRNQTAMAGKVRMTVKFASKKPLFIASHPYIEDVFS